jgi:hypothetical protein
MSSIVEHIASRCTRIELVAEKYMGAEVLI